jgi:hypothetical protein
MRFKEMYRTVLGHVARIISPNYEKAFVKVTLLTGSLDANGIVPKQSHTVEVDENGDFSLSLWCNDNGDIPSLYAVYFPNNDVYKFILPSTSTLPVRLEELIEIGLPDTEPQYQIIANYIDQKLEDLIIETNPTQDILSITVVASAALSALKIGCIDLGATLKYADSSLVSDFNKPMGIIRNALSVGATDRLLTYGYIESESWSFDTGKSLFLGLNGAITQVPPTTGFIKQVGLAITPTKIFVFEGYKFML